MPYQPPSLRQVCEAAPISDRPGGDVVAQAWRLEEFRAEYGKYPPVQPYN